MHKSAPWIAGLVIVTGIFGTILLTVQQSLRASANDPQIQLAQDMANQATSGKLALSAPAQININKSLAPFVNIYDGKGQPIGGNGYLNGRLAKPPLGVLQAADNQDYNAVTWQPTKEVRLASISVKGGKYYVLSGRSLTEAEKREDHITKITLTGWLASLLVLGIAYRYSGKPGKRGSNG